jgi:hypothetical protein
MERGKLSTYSIKEHDGVAGPYYKLQRWEQGKNHTRHFPTEQVPAVRSHPRRLRPLPAAHRAICRCSRGRDTPGLRRLKKTLPPTVLLAQDEEIQRLIARYQA